MSSCLVITKDRINVFNIHEVFREWISAEVRLWSEGLYGSLRPYQRVNTFLSIFTIIICLFPFSFSHDFV